jgi:hypothetical protein
MHKLVLDTNIIISALHRAESDPDIILSIVLDQEAKIALLYLSKDIFEEYKEVLFRDKFSYFNQARVKNVLRKIKQVAMWVEPKVQVNVVKVDPADNKFLECALACQADFLITGNIRHFPFKEFHQTRVVNPGDFLELIGEISF